MLTSVSCVQVDVELVDTTCPSERRESLSFWVAGELNAQTLQKVQEYLESRRIAWASQGKEFRITQAYTPTNTSMLVYG